MFKFDFVHEETEHSADDASKEVTTVQDPYEAQAILPPSLVVTTVDEMVEDLPPLISYSPLRVPLSGEHSITLLRRDLFDARFQLISEDKASKDLGFIDAPSDLVPGVYEGGLKTWECSADLAGYLTSVDIPAAHRGYKIIEIGCGTAIPSLSLLQKVFGDPEGGLNDQETNITLHLQDYNFAVLQLVTLPNIILTWYASPASTSYRASQSLPEIDISESGELAITPELISSFLDSLRKRHIELGFFSGAWSDLETRIREAQIIYNLTLTSETIYRSASLPSLVSLLRTTFSPHESEEMDTTSSNKPAQHSIDKSTTESMPFRCLVAAKVIYFGVGGGIDEFERVVKETGGRLNMVLENKVGVGRRIMSIDWIHSA